MVGTGGGGSGSGGGDSNEERLRKMVVDHLTASELSTIDTRTAEGLTSLIAILGQALQTRLTAGEAQRDEEARKAAEAKAAEKKRKRDETATTGVLSPRSVEKKRRKDERDAIRKAKLDLKKKEEERKKLPLITLAEEGIPTELAYTGAKSTIRHIVSTNFARGVEWGTLSKAEQKRVINQVKGAFRNGGELDSQWIADKISNSMFQARYHDRMKIRGHLRDLNVYRNLERPLQFSEDIWDAFYQSEVQLKAARQLKEVTEQLAKAKKAREFGRSDRDLKALELKVAECQSVVDEVGDPPLKFLKVAERVKLVPNTTHKLGQGGIPGLKAAFVSTLTPSPPFLSCKDSHVCEILSSHLLCLRYLCDAIPLRYLCDANCIAKIGIWRFRVAIVDTMGLVLQSFSMRRSALRKSGRRFE